MYLREFERFSPFLQYSILFNLVTRILLRLNFARCFQNNHANKTHWFQSVISLQTAVMVLTGVTLWKYPYIMDNCDILYFRSVAVICFILVHSFPLHLSFCTFVSMQFLSSNVWQIRCQKKKVWNGAVVNSCRRRIHFKLTISYLYRPRWSRRIICQHFSYSKSNHIWDLFILLPLFKIKCYSPIFFIILSTSHRSLGGQQKCNTL